MEAFPQQILGSQAASFKNDSEALQPSHTLGMGTIEKVKNVA